MLTCPRCGNQAEYLPDDLFTLIHCEFCGENLDAADLLLRVTLGRMAQGAERTRRQGTLAPGPAAG